MDRSEHKYDCFDDSVIKDSDSSVSFDFAYIMKVIDNISVDFT